MHVIDANFKNSRNLMYLILRHLYHQESYESSTSLSVSVDVSSFNIDLKVSLDLLVYRSSSTRA